MEDLEILKSNPLEYAENMDIKSLVKFLQLCSEKYYNTGTPLVSDEVYDILVEVLRHRSPKNKFFEEVGAPIKSKDKVKLPYWMGSMDKIKDEDKINKWVKKFKGPYIISDKLDGVSCLFVAKKGDYKLYTRGDGEKGQDITKLFPFLKNTFEVEDDVVMRGELIISKKDFKKMKSDSNARNIVAGLVNSKTIDSSVQDKLKYVSLIMYEVIEPELSPKKQFSYLESLGINVDYDTVSTLSYEFLKEKLTERKENGEYDVDGLIITDTKKYERNISGNPEYSIAFKMKGDTKNAIVEDVEWNVSKDGLLIPRIRIKPIDLGVKITYTSGFNAKFIVDGKIGKGAIIKMIRSGDVIPYVLEVVEPAKKTAEPSQKYEWNETNVHYRLVDMEDNEAMNIKLLVKFVKTLEIENVGAGIIQKLFDNDINTIEKILTVTEEELLEIDGIKTTMAKKIVKNIQDKLNNIPLHKLMDASNKFGAGLGEKKLKKIVEDIPEIMDIVKGKKKSKELKEKIISLDGFNEITATSFMNGLPKFADFYNEVEEYITIAPIKEKKKTGKWKTVVFSGFRNKEWSDKIEENGGKVSTTVSKNTDILVYKPSDKGSSKYEKAVSLGVKIMTEDEFSKLI